MNRIYAVVWSRAKHAWVVVSELASALVKGPRAPRLVGMNAALLAAAVWLCMDDAHAQTVINNTGSQQNLNSSSNYVVNSGTTVTVSGGQHAIVVQGISPFTLTVRGNVRGTATGSYAAVEFAASGTLVNESTGNIWGSTYGVAFNGTTNNFNIINRGDISVQNSHPIAYGAGGTFDNYGTINGGRAGTVGTTPNGVTVSSTKAVTINNFAGASIRSGTGDATYGNGIEIFAAGALTVNNEGTLTGHHSAISARGAGGGVVNVYNNGGTITGNLKPALDLLGTSWVRNAGTISGPNGAINFTGTGNQVILERTSSITGFVNAGTNGTLALAGASGAGTFNLGNIGASQQYRNFTIFEKREAGAWNLTGSGNQNWSVLNGRLILNSGASLTGTTLTVAPGGTFQYGTGGTGGAAAPTITDNGAVVFNRGDATVYSQAITGTGSVTQSGPGTLTYTGNNTYTGGTTIDVGATLQVGNGGAVGHLPGTSVLDNGLLIFNRSDAVTFAGDVSGTGAFRHSGVGMLTLTGTNTHTGGTTIATNGTLQVGAGGAVGSIAGNIVNNGTLIANRSGDLHFDGVISGTGTLIKRGSGTLQLSADNSFVGPTRFEAGVLSATFAANFGEPGNALIFDGGTLRWLNSFFIGRPAQLLAGGGTLDSNGRNVEWRAPTTGSGTLTKVGAGTLFVTATNTYTGGTRVLDGVLQLGNGGTAGSVLGNVENHAEVIFNRSDDVAFDGLISGVGSVTQLGPGNLIWTANHTYTGGTTISGGSLQLGNGGSTGALLGNVTNNGLLILNRGDNVTDAPGLISGSGGLTQRGPGTATFTRNHTYTGLTTISGGTLRLGDGGVAGGIAGDILNNATLIHDRSDLVDYTGSLSGTGNFLKDGSGTLRLTSSNPFAGDTQIVNGRLLVDGSLGGTVTVGSDSALGGFGVLSGLVTVANGGHLTPGESPGTLTIGTLVLDATSQLDYELGLPDVVGGGVNDLVSVTGDMTLDGVLNITDLGGFGNGVYRLFDYGGTLTDNGLLFGASPLGFGAGDFLLQTSVLHQINLIVTQGGTSLQFWDGPNEVGNGVIDGGTSVWNTLNTRWTNSDGVVNAPWQNGFAVFQGTAGTVTLGENIRLTGAQFLTDGYVIDGAGFQLSSDGTELPFRVDSGVTATINAPILDGSGGALKLIKREAGTLVLGADNAYSGGTAVEGGKLQISADSQLGALGGALELDTGTLVTTTSFGGARAVQLGSGGGAIAPAAGTTLVWSGVISGSGQLDKQDAGTLVLTANNLYNGGTRILGTLQLGDGGSSGAILGDIANDGSLVVNRADALSLDGVISGNGELVQQGGGTTTLTGLNTYLGGTRINGGVLQADTDAQLGAASGGLGMDGGTLRTGVGFTSTRAVSLGAAGGVIDDATNASFSGVFSGVGGLTKAGAGVTTLSADNTYTGGTTISIGSLQLGDGGGSGNVVGDILDNGSLIFNRNDAYGFAGVISGSGDVSVLGGGTLMLGGVNTYAGIGGTQVRDGSTLVIGSNANLGNATTRVLLTDTSTLRVTNSFSLTRAIELEGSGFAMIDSQGNTATITGVVSGDAGLRKLGAGLVILGQDNTYTGGTDIAEGSLQIGDGGAIGSVLGNIGNAGTLQFNRFDTYTYAGQVSGTGALVQIGAGTLVLSADHSYTGLTLITNGRLQIGAGGTSGSVVGDIVDSTELIFNRSDALVYNGAISGIGALSKQGAGTLTLGGASTYAGGTTVAAGRLLIGGSIHGDALVQSGASLGGSGSITGTVTVADGGTLAPGMSPGTLTLGNLLLNAGSILDYELGLPGVIGGGVNDLVTVTGNLTLDGTLNVQDAGAFGNGVYRLFDYGGTFTDNGLLLGSLPAGIAAADVLVQTSTPLQVNLIVSTGGFGLQFWDGPNLAGNGVIDGGTSAWNTTETRWTNADGSVNATWQGGFAVFQGTAGTVTLAASQDFSGAQFRSDGYVIDGAGFALRGVSADTVLRVDPGVTATFNAALQDGSGGAVRLRKTDAGTLILGLPNSYSGGTAIEGGRLQVAADNALGAAGTALTLDGGVWATTATFGSARPITLGVDGGGIATGAGTTLTLSGVVDGVGGLQKLEAGTLVLGATNTYAGGTRLSAGVLAVSADAGLGASAGSLVFDGGILRLDASFDLAATRAVTLEAPGGSIDSNGQDSIWTQAIQGAGGLTKLGTGMLTLAGDNLYAGGTTISGGTLRIGAGGAVGSVLGDMLNNGTLLFARGGILGYGGAISGTGSVTQQGPGTLVLTGDHTYTGGTTISGGILQLGDDTSTGSVTGNIVDNAALVFARSDDLTYAGTISGTGTVTQTGASTLTFTGNHGYSGGTGIDAGATLQLGDGGTSGSVVGNIDNDGMLVFNRDDDIAFAGEVTGSGAVLKVGAGQLTVLGNVGQGGTITIDAGILRVGDGGNGGTLGGDIVNNATLVFQRNDAYGQGSAISGTGLLEQRGTGLLLLGGSNTYSGGTLISAGTLQIGNGMAGSVVGDIANQSALIFQRDDDVSFDGVISGTGTLTKQGAGRLILGGANTLSGLSTVATGSLQVDGTLGGDVLVQADAALGGIGVIAGAVTVADDGHLSPGDSPGTLTVGDLLLSDASQLDYELGLPNVVGGGVNDLVTVTGDLTLDGVLNITDLGGFGNGVYRLFDYGGTLTDSGLLFGALPTGIVTGDLLLQTAVVSQVNLIVSQGGLSIQFWDGPNEVGNGVIDGGTSVWNTLNTRWTNSDGSVNAPWQNGFAVFQGSAGIVTLGEDIALTGAQFVTDGYVVEGGGFGLHSDDNALPIRVDTGATATINAAISDGAGGALTLIKRDGGTLVLGVDNAYTGGTAVEGGILRIGADAALGAAGTTLSLDGGTLATTGNFTSARAVTLGVDGGGIAPVAGSTLTWAGVISGAGGLDKLDAGTLILTGTNTYTGGTDVTGTLQLGDGGGSGSVTGDIANDGTLIFNRNNVLVIDSRISGSGTVIQQGSGVTLLNVANTYTGGTFLNGGVIDAVADNRLGAASGGLTFNGGTLHTGVGFDSGRAVTLAAGGGTLEDQGGASFHGVFSGGGHLTKTGAGMTTLTADNGYTGGTTISGGALRLGDGGTSGSVLGDIVDNAALIFDRSDAYQFAGAISGSGEVSVLGGGTLTLSGANSYSGAGGTQVRAGSTLVVGSDGNLGAASAQLLLANASTLRLTASFGLTRAVVLEGAGSFDVIDTQANTASIAGVVSGDAGLRKLGGGTLILQADNTYAGGTEVAAGTLQIGNGGASGSVTGNLVNAGAVVFNRSDTLNYAGWSSGTGSLTQAGTGTLVLTGTHLHAGGTFITAGTLQVGAGGTSGSVAGAIDNDGALIFNRADAFLHAGVISGSGSVTQLGPGKLTLSALNTYTGLTTVAAGSLSLTGALAGAAQVAAGATLGGTGVIAGDVTVADGGILAPGASAGTLSVGALTLNPASVLDYELGLPNVIGGGVNDLITVTGNLTLDGQLNVHDVGGFGNGVYRLIDYGGVLTNNGLLFGTLPAGVAANELLLQTSIVNQVNLVVIQGGFGLQFWDGPNTVGNGNIDGGTAIWNTTDTRWTNADGAVNAPWQQGFAVFQGAAGTVTLGEDVALTGAQFRTDGYVVSGAGFALSGVEAELVLRVDPGVTATLDAGVNDGVGGPAQVVKTDLGTLVLNGVNGYSGGTVIRDGTLRINSDAALGAVGSGVLIEGATLASSADIDSARAIQLLDEGGQFAPATGSTLRLSGLLSGGGGLAKTDGGVLALTGINTYEGGTLLQDGVLAISSDANLGATTGNLRLSGGSLRLDADTTLAASRDVLIDIGGGRIDTQAFQGRIDSNVQGGGGLTKAGSGSLMLTGDDGYLGGTTIEAGRLQIGDGGTTGRILGNVANAGTLAFARTDTVTFAGVVSGDGDVVQQGPGTLVFTADHAYTGGTTIAAGTLQLGDGTAGGSVVGDILDNGSLVFARSDDVTHAGTIGGSGNVVQQGPGTLVFTADHGYTGGTRVASGTRLQLGAGGTTGSVVGDIVDDGDLIFARADDISFGGAISGSGALTQQGTGMLTVLGNLTMAGGTTIAGGALRIGDGGTLGMLSGDILNHGALIFDHADTYTQSSMVQGSGSLEQRGTGTLLLTADNAYSGGTLISAGTLRIGQGVTGSVSGDIQNNSALVFARDDDVVFSGVISGTGNLTQQGTGRLTLTAAHSFTGLTTVAQGRLQIDGSMVGDAQVDGGATLGGNGSIAGLVHVADGAHLAPGDSPGTLSVGSLWLEGGALLDYELGLAGVIGGGVNDLIEVAGDLTLDGTLNISNLGGFGNGVYRLMNYGGTLIDNGLLLGQLPLGVGAGDALVQTSVDSEVNLVVNRGGFALQFWDGPDSVGDGAVDGGTAVWDNLQTHWTNISGATNIDWQSGFAVFGAAAGTVTLGDEVSISGMQFRSGGYHIVGNGFSIAADARDTIIRVDVRGVATIDAPLVDGNSGSARLIQRDRGLLVLNGANTYSGGTQVDGGFLQIANDGNLGAAGTDLGLDAGTLITTGNFSSGRAVTLGRGHGVFAPVEGTTLTWNGVIGGEGGLSKVDAGTLVLNADNTYGVGTFLGNGVVQASRDANLGRAEAALVFGGGTLRWGADFDVGAARRIVISGMGRFDTAGHVGRITQSIQGDGALIKQGEGTLVLSGDNVYAGGTGILAGTLQIGDGGATGSVMGDIENLGTVAFARADDHAYAGTIIGSGDLIQRGAGTLILIADQGYTGGTHIASGALMLGQGGTTGSVMGDIANDGELLFNRSDDLLYEGAVSGSGSLTKMQNNVLALTGEHAYTGGTTIQAGQLRIGNGGASGSLLGDVDNAGELAFHRSGTLNFGGAIGGAGSVRNLGAGVVTLSGANTYSGGTFMDGGVLSVASDGALGDVGGDLYFDGGTLRLTSNFDSTRAVHLDAGNGAIETQGTRNKFSGHLEGGGTLLKTGDGVLILNQGGSHAGGTQVLAGTLVVGDSAHVDAALRNGDVSVAAGAFFGGYGSVSGNVLNAGFIGIGNALPALATEPDASFTIAGNLYNHGTVSLANGVAADQLVIKQGAFVAMGGLMQLDTVLNGGDIHTQSDQLITDGVLRDNGGVTGLHINAVGGSGQVTDGDGIRLVDVAPGGVSQAGAFALANRVVAGTHEYLLFQGSPQHPEDGDWYLRSESNEPLAPLPILRPEIGAFLGNRYFSERMFIHSLHQRQAEPDPSLDSDDEERGPVWVNVNGVTADTRSADGLVALRSHSWRLQAGVDLLRRRGSSGGVLRGGAFVQYGEADTSAGAVENPWRADGEVKGYGIGVYGTWLGDPQRQLGAYVDGWLQYGRFDNSVTGSLGFQANYDAHGWAASLEAGYGIALTRRIVLEPQLQYIRLNLDTDRLIDSSRTAIRDTSRSDWVARVGMRLYGVPDRPMGFSPFIELNWWRRDGNSSLVFNEDRMEHYVPRDMTTLDVGVQGEFAPGWGVWLRLGSDLSESSYRELNGTVGVRYQW